MARIRGGAPPSAGAPRADTRGAPGLRQLPVRTRILPRIGNKTAILAEMTAKVAFSHLPVSLFFFLLLCLRSGRAHGLGASVLSRLPADRQAKCSPRASCSFPVTENWPIEESESRVPGEASPALTACQFPEGRLPGGRLAGCARPSALCPHERVRLVLISSVK